MVKWIVVMKIQPTFYLMTEGSHVKFQPGWLGAGFDLGTSQIRVQCVATAPTNSVTRVDGFSQSVKILSMTSFGREVNPWVPCLRFMACKRTSSRN